jgi:ABC-type multidrug transport system ATPase subunit
MFSHHSGAVVCSLFVLGAVVSEKQQKLLGALRNMGVFESAYWISWLLAFVALFLVIAPVIVLVGRGLAIDLFTKCSFVVHWLAMSLLLCSSASLSFMFAAVATKQRWVNVASLLYIMSTIVIVSLLSVTIAATGSDFYQIYNGATLLPPAVIFFLPAAHYARILGDIGRVITPLAEVKLDDWNAGAVSVVSEAEDFSWSHLTRTEFLPFGCDVAKHKCFSPPPTSWELIAMLLNTLLYTLLAWYFSQVFAAQGANQPFYFIFSPAYWGFKRKKNVVRGDVIGDAQQRSFNEQSVCLHKLSKSYDKVTAVKEVTFSMKQGEVCGLLGQNGAGKTSVIKVLSGLYNPTHGEAFVNGLSVRDDAVQIQSMLGMCPQEDILWPQLSARQHLDVVCGFKNVPPPGAERDDYLDNILADVHLLGVQGPSSSFSGGMKRRLLCAMCFVGDPKFMVLDEPTTGMDPISKRAVWAAITKRKVGTVVCLTSHRQVRHSLLCFGVPVPVLVAVLHLLTESFDSTVLHVAFFKNLHSMDEAEALSDQIAIMFQGRLRAVGNSMYLKRRFGTGYQIDLLAEPSQTDNLRARVERILPNAEVLNVSGTLREKILCLCGFVVRV